jgi:hypothetical protein
VVQTNVVYLGVHVGGVFQNKVNFGPGIRMILKLRHDVLGCMLLYEAKEA